MTESQVVFRCPHCAAWTFEASQPDSWHSSPSFDEPLLGIGHGEVKKQTITCQNRNCRKQITLYWYAPMEYFDRM